MLGGRVRGGGGGHSKVLGEGVELNLVNAGVVGNQMGREVRGRRMGGVE